MARRWFLRDCGVGLGSMALAQLLGPPGAMRGDATIRQPASGGVGVDDPLAVRAPISRPRRSE